MHHADRLRIAFEVAQILADHGVKLAEISALRLAFDTGHQRIHQLQRKVLFKPVVNGRLAEMAERRITDVVQQAGHLYQAFKRALHLVQPVLRQTALIFQGLQDLFGDIASRLLHFQRMSEARAHCGVALQRKNLGFLLQSANRRRVDNTAAIALKVAGNIVFPFRLFARVIRASKTDLLPEINRRHRFPLYLRESIPCQPC